MVRRFVGRMASRAVAWAEKPYAPRDPVGSAVKGAFAQVGLPLSEYQPTYDIFATGKLPQVIYHAIKALDHNVRTVADIEALLKR